MKSYNIYFRYFDEQKKDDTQQRLLVGIYIRHNSDEMRFFFAFDEFIEVNELLNILKNINSTMFFSIVIQTISFADVEMRIQFCLLFAAHKSMEHMFLFSSQ